MRGMNLCTAPYNKLKEALVNKTTLEIPPGDFCRPRYMANVLEQRLTLYHMGDNEADKDVQALIGSLCAS